MVVAFGDSSAAKADDGTRLLGGFTARLQARINKTVNAISAPAAPAAETLRTTANIAANNRSARASEQRVTEQSQTATRNSSASAENEQPAQEAVAAPLIESVKTVTPELTPLMAKEVVVPTTTFVVPPQPVAIEAPPARVAPLPLESMPTLESAEAPRMNRELVPEFVAPLAVSPSQPLAPLSAPPVSKVLVPPVEAEPDVALTLPPAIAPAAPAARVRELPPYVEPKAAEIPVALPPPLSTAQPSSAANVGRELTPIAESLARETPVTAAVPSSTAAPSSEKAAPSTDAARFPSQDAAPARATNVAPGTKNPGPPAVNAGSPQGSAAKTTDDIFGPRSGDTVGTTAGTTPGTLSPAPRTDLDQVRQRARELGSSGTGPKTVFKFPTAPPPVAKKKIEEIFDKLKRPDCKDAYADMGLAAAAPLIRDALTTEKGCKW